MKDLMGVYLRGVFGKEAVLTTGHGGYIVRGLGVMITPHGSGWKAEDTYWDYEEEISPHELMKFLYFLKKKMQQMVDEDTAYINKFSEPLSEYKLINVYREYVDGEFELVDSDGRVRRKLRVEVLQDSHDDYYLVGHLGGGIPPIKSTVKIHSIEDIDRAIPECYEFLGLRRADQ